MKRITGTVDPDDHAALERMAQHGDVTTSWLFRRSVREFTEHHERGGVVALTLPHVRRANEKGRG